MGEFLRYAWTVAAGGAIGTMFFGGLWWTVRNAPGLPVPGLWFLGSSLLRTVAALVGFRLASDGDWRRIVACLAGFVAARLAVTWLTRTDRKAMPIPNREVNDAA